MQTRTRLPSLVLGGTLIALVACTRPPQPITGTLAASPAPLASASPGRATSAGTGQVLVYTDWKALAPLGRPGQVLVTLTPAEGSGATYYAFTPGSQSGDPGVDASGIARFTGLAPGGYHVAIRALSGTVPLGSAQRDIFARASASTDVYLPVQPAQVHLPPQPPSSCGSGLVPYSIYGTGHWLQVLGGTAPVEAYGQVRGSWFADDDLPGDHKGHDRNFYLAPDSDYAGLLADSNDTDGRNDGRLLMECEWDSEFNPKNQQTTFPVAGWPIVGDRVWVSGPWIYDCFHAFKGFQIPVHTEIHVWDASPTPEAVAFTRFDPTIFYPSDSAPSLTYRTYLTAKAGFGAQDYVFDVPLPPQTPGASAVFRVDQALPPGVSIELTPIIPPDVLKVGDPLSLMAPADFQSRTAHVRVHFRLDPAAGALGYTGTITAGWWQPTSTLAYEAARVDLTSLAIHATHSSALLSSSLGTNTPDWWLWVQGGDQWLDLNDMPALHPVVGPETLSLAKSTHEFFVLDGQVSQDQAFANLWPFGFPKTSFAAGITDTGWRSGDLDYNYGCATCVTSLLKNSGLGEVPLALVDNPDESAAVPPGGSAAFGPLYTVSPEGQDNPAPDASGDMAISGTVDNLGTYPVGAVNPPVP